MPNDENKIILEFPATNVEIELGETITFDNISGFLDAERVTYNGDSLTEKITHLENNKADTTYVNTELGKKADKSNTYTKTETNSLVSPKADKTYVDSVADTKADKDTTYTKSEVDTLIDNLPEPMIFKGTLGVGGTIQSLPTASASNEGWTYKVITDGTYAGQTAKVGDVFTSNGSAWVYIPSGDEDNDTWRNIKVNGTEVLGNGISSGAVDFEDTTNVKFEFDANGNKIKAKLDGIYAADQVDTLLDDKADADNTYTKAQVDDIVYGILPDDTASGSVANFTTSLELPIKSLEIDVNAVQDLHGYGSAWVAGAGKNVVDTRNIDTTTAGVHVTSDADGVISMSGTRDASTGWKTFAVFSDFPTGDYVFSTNNSHVTCLLNYTQKTSRFTVNTGDTVRLALNLSSGDVVSDTNIKVQIEKGSTATEWTPYENICPISGRSAIKLINGGRNMVDIRPFNEFEITSSYSVLMNCVPNTKIRASLIDKDPSIDLTGISFGFVDSKWDKTSPLTTKQYRWIVQMGVTANDKSNTSVYNTSIILTGLIFYPKTEATYNKVMSRYNIEFEVDTVTTYEPFNGNTEVINLGGTYYGGYFTQDKAGHRQFVATYKKLILNGTENWSVIDDGTATRAFIDRPVDKKLDDTSAICNRFGYGNATMVGKFDMGNTYFRFNIYGIADSKESFNAWLRENETYVVYPLATPIVIDLPDGQPIITINGTNNIYADTGDASVVFKNSVNGYVEKKIANVQALALNT